MKKLSVFILMVVVGYYGVHTFLGISNMPPTVAPELQSMVQQWKNQMRKQGIEYKAGFNRIKAIQIVDDYGVSAGHFDKGTRTISISKAQILEGYFSTRVTLWHELGHYVYDLDHDNNPEKIMYHKSLNENDYKLIWDDMKDSYFIKCRSNEWEARL
jgi:hypothetical protein